MLFIAFYIAAQISISDVHINLKKITYKPYSIVIVCLLSYIIYSGCCHVYFCCVKASLSLSLPQESTDWANLKHPCYPSGYNITMLAEEVFGSECTKNDLPTKYSPKPYIAFFGQSNPEQCKSLVRSIFDLTSCQGTENCSFDGVYQPPLSGDFMVGISRMLGTH